MPTSGPTPVRGLRREARRRVWLLAGVGLVVVLAFGAYITSSTDQGPAAQPGPSGTRPPTTRPAPPTMSYQAESDKLKQFTATVLQVLRRVAPGAVAGEPRDYFISNYITRHTSTGYETRRTVDVNGRRGVLTIVASWGERDVTCEGFTASACHIWTGPQGDTFWAVDFERTVPRGQPRDLQVGATVLRTGGSWVDVTLTNEAEVVPLESIPAVVASHTGLELPLTLDQVIALASDPALDVCASGCHT